MKMKMNKLIIISKEACDCVKHRCQFLRLRNIDDRWRVWNMGVEREVFE